MERKEEEDLNNSTDSEESSNVNDRDRRFILSYNQKNVRSLNIDEILHRMCEFRQHSQSLDTLPGPSGTSTNTRERSSSSSPPASRESRSSPPGSRVTFYPEFRRQIRPAAMILNQLPAGCIRTSPSSPKRAAGLYINPYRTQFQGYSSGEGTSTSRSDWESFSSPVSPSESPRKTSRGHPFGLGSEGSSGIHMAKDSAPIEFLKIENQEKSDKSDEPGDKGDHGESDNTGDQGKNKNDRANPDSKDDKNGGHGEPDTKGEGIISTETL